MKKSIFKSSLGVIVTLLFLALATSALADDYFVYSDTAVIGNACGGYRINDYSGNLYVDSAGICRVFKVAIPEDSSAYKHQHPLNPFSTGPVVTRTFTLVERYDFSADCGWSGGHHAEFYVDDTHIYYGVRSSGDSAIAKWDKITTPGPNYGKFGDYKGHLHVPGMNGETFGYDVGSGKWFTGTRNDGAASRDVYSCKVDDPNWTFEFAYTSFGGGGHHDGLECAGGCVFVSDMYADSIGKWEYVTGTWNEVGRYGYTEPHAWNVEGLGYGPLDHFWSTNTFTLYEFGGGELIVEIPTLTEWGLIIFGVVLIGFITWVFLKRKKVVGVRA